MKKYIYLSKKEALKGTSLVVAVLEERNANYKKEYGDDIVEFVGEDLPHYITYLPEADTVREATEEEKLERNQLQLEDNQVLLNGVIYTYDKKFQKVVGNEIVEKTMKELVEEKIISLDEVKLQKREELKVIRDEKVHSNIEVHGEVFQVREQDIENFMDVERALNKGYKKPTDKRFWILANNSIKEFTYEQLSQVLDEKAKRKDLIFQKFGEISMKLAQCETVEDIESIEWE